MENGQVESVDPKLASIEQSLAIFHERQLHLTSSMDKLVESNIETNRSINDLVKCQVNLTHELHKSDEIQRLKNDEQDEAIGDLKGRVRTLERYNDLNHGERRASDKTKAWWSQNWWLIVSLFVLSIPLIDFLYERVTGKVDERKIIIERIESGDTDDSTD